MFVTATPIIAFELAVGGTDVPIIALICLGFALLWRHPRPVLAGLAFGGAASMKATAWPAIVVAVALALARDGKRAAAVMTAVSLGVVAALVGPFAVLRPDSLVKNTILFPLGLASVTSQAVSPLPGHLIAQTGHAGRLFVIAMLALSGVAVLASLVRAATPERPVSRHPARHRAVTDVRAGAGDALRLLHLPGRHPRLADRSPTPASVRSPETRTLVPRPGGRAPRPRPVIRAAVARR